MPHLFTLEDFLRLGSFPGMENATGYPEANSVSIKGCAIVQGRSASTLRRGELALSDAIDIRTAREMNAFITTLSACGACAIGLSALVDKTLATDAIKRCAELSVSLVMIPAKYRLSDLAAAVQERLAAESGEAASWRELQSSLLSAFLKRQSINAAATLIARQLGTDVLIVDAVGTILGSTDGRARYDVISEYELREYWPFIKLNYSHRPLGSIYIPAADFSYERLETQRLYARYIMPPLLLWFEREEPHKPLREVLMDSLMRQLTKQGIAQRRDAAAKAERLGVSLDRHFACLVGRLVPRIGIDALDWLDSNAASLSSYLCRTFPMHMISVIDGSIVAFLDAAEPYEKFVRQLESELSTFDDDMLCLWGYCESDPDKGFETLYQDALMAASFNDGIGEKRCFTQRDVELAKVLESALRDDTVKKLVNSKLAPLMQLDAQSRNELIQMLLCYFENGCNTCATARVLHFHRQSLRNRLMRIERMLGISLSNHKESFVLEFCLRVMQASFAN